MALPAPPPSRTNLQPPQPPARPTDTTSNPLRAKRTTSLSSTQQPPSSENLAYPRLKRTD